MSTKGKVIIISGPSGSGKTTLHQKLLASGKLRSRLVKSISATTRTRRPGEKNGKDYIFLTKKAFLSRRDRGYFLEWEKVFDNYYGTPKKKVDTLIRSGKNVLLCIDVKGAKTAGRCFPDAVRIFIKTPTIGDLKRRLAARGSETKKDLALRLATARRELKEAGKYDHIVVNGRLSAAFKNLEKIVCKALSP